MPASTKYQGDGRAITKAVQAEIQRAGIVMDLHREWTHYPEDFRRQVQRDETRKVTQARAEGRSALEAWARSAVADAQRRYGARPVGTAAEETRANTEEVRIGRILDSARAGGNARGTAQDLADQADRAFASGDHDGANVLARAALELGSTNHMAAEIVKTVQLDRDLADPDRAKAIRDLNDVGVVLAAFDRDTQAATSQALQHSARLAAALGDGATAMKASKDAAEASVRAKMEALYGGQAFGDGTYTEPAGTLPGGPTGADGGKLPGGEGVA